MNDWKDNKYGREADYSTLHDAEDWKFGVVGWLVIVVLLGCAGLFLWSAWDIF